MTTAQTIQMGAPDRETINEILEAAGSTFVQVEAYKVPNKKTGDVELRVYRINTLQPVERVPEEQRKRDAAEFKDFVKQNMIRLVDQAALEKDADGEPVLLNGAKISRKQFSGKGGGTISFYWQRVAAIVANKIRYEFQPVDIELHPDPDKR